MIERKRIGGGSDTRRRGRVEDREERRGGEGAGRGKEDSGEGNRKWRRGGLGQPGVKGMNVLKLG